MADDGTLVYLPGETRLRDSRGWWRVDRAGRSRVLDPNWQGRFASVDVAPDGRRVAVATAEGFGSTLWMKQLDAGPLTRLTFGTGSVNYRGSWMPDGRSLSYSSDTPGPRHPPVPDPGRRERQARATLPR